MSQDDELQRRIQLLMKAVQDGKLTVSDHLKDQVSSSLDAVQKNADGSINLDTVNPMIRSMSLGITMMHDREEGKKEIPLFEIQKAYFGFISINFSHIYKLMVDTKKDPEITARFFSEDTGRRNDLLKCVPELLDHIKELWNSCGEVAWNHLEDMRCLKLSHAGDLFPSYSHNLASKCGIYSDTIVLPDPFIRTIELYNMWDDKQKVYYMIKHAMSVLAYKDLALAEFDNPIVVVLPELKFLEQSEGDFLQKLAEKDAVKLAGNIFGREFSSFEETMFFCHALDSKSKVLAEIHDGSKLIADIYTGNNTSEQLDELCNSPLSMINKLNPGQIVMANCIGRMSQANDALVKSRRLRGVPVIDAPTSWRYFNWKLELDGIDFDKEQAEHLHCSHALTSLEDTELSWLGNIPSEALIDIRKQGALEEIREIMSKNIGSIIESNPENFGKTSYQVFKNFQSAFADHNKEIEELKKKKWKFAGVDIGSMVCVGAIELAAVATGSPLFGAVGWISGQVLDTPRIKDLPNKYKELIKEDQGVKNSPIGMLVQCKK